MAEAAKRAVEMPRAFGGSTATAGKAVTALLTVVAVLESKRVHGLIALRNEPRDDAREGLERLKALGLRAVMLTADRICEVAEAPQVHLPLISVRDSAAQGDRR